MRLCYLILVHHKFEQAARLVSRLVAPGVSVVMHVDAKVAAADVERFKAMLPKGLALHWARRIDAAWGTYRQALAIMNGIDRVIDSNLPFDRCVLLSGQDYPIASHAEIVAFFEANPVAEYAEAYDLDVADAAAGGWSPYYRFRRHHVWLGKRRFTVPGLRKPMPRIPLFHGSTWWALTAEALRHVRAAFHADRALQRHLSTGFLVDEVLVPSLLMASPLASNVKRANLTFAEWTPTSGPHPKLLRLEDVPALVASPKLFARKFDAAQDSAVLDALDRLHAEPAFGETILTGARADP